MMIKRSTWILLILLVLVIGAYFIIKNHPASSAIATPTALGDNYLFTKADGNLQNLLISDTQGDVFQMLRDPSGTWMIAKPTSAKADQSLASAADTQISALRIITLLDTPLDLDVAQLTKPAYTFELSFSSGSQHKLEIGGLTPTSSGYYVRRDGGSIYVVSMAGIDALLNLLKSPPYPATATPTIEPTATPGLGTPTTTP